MAACAVVVHHAGRAFTTFRSPDANLPAPIVLSNSQLFDPLAIGVDLFFVISGFIMAYVSEPYVSGKKPVSDFLLRRIWRIYPLYWLITLYVCFDAFRTMSISGAGWPFDLTFERIVGSVLLWPTYNVKDAVQPILGVGWTLSYEMMFYLCFCMALRFSPRNLLPAILLLFTAVNLLAHFFPPGLAVLEFLQNPIIFEFALGAALASLFRTGWLSRVRVWLVWSAAFSSLPLALMFPGSSPWRAVAWGIPAFLIAASFVRVETFGPKNKSLALLGDASYSIYLVHTPVVYAISSRVMGKYANWLTGIPTDLVLIADIAIAVLAGCVVYFALERPLLAMQPTISSRAKAMVSRAN